MKKGLAYHVRAQAPHPAFALFWSFLCSPNHVDGSIAQLVVTVALCYVGAVKDAPAMAWTGSTVCLLRLAEKLRRKPSQKKNTSCEENKCALEGNGLRQRQKRGPAMHLSAVQEGLARGVFGS